MSQPSSSSTPKPEQSAPNTPSIAKKTPPLPWSHIETVNLIQAYQEKWYSLKRGQLKASQWEEVAVSVAARCGYNELSKSATQCRHKMEKLRKRYRGEKQRPFPSAWTYFDMMDMMERGPLPISARPIALPPRQGPVPPPSNSSDEELDDENEEEDDDESNKSRSINHILHRRATPVTSPIFDALPLPNKYIGGGGSGGRGQGPGVSRFKRNPMFRKRKRYDIEEEMDDDDDVGKLLSELASVVRAFGEGFIMVENMKMEMMKETEKHRIEMEKKRTELVQESQRCIVEAISKTFESCKKSKKNQETLVGGVGDTPCDV